MCEWIYDGIGLRKLKLGFIAKFKNVKIYKKCKLGGIPFPLLLISQQ